MLFTVLTKGSDQTVHFHPSVMSSNMQATMSLQHRSKHFLMQLKCIMYNQSIFSLTKNRLGERF